VDPALNALPEVNVRVNARASRWSAQLQAAAGLELGISATEAESQQLATDAATATLTTVDVPAAVGAAQRAYKAGIAQMRVTGSGNSVHAFAAWQAELISVGRILTAAVIGTDPWSAWAPLSTASSWGRYNRLLPKVQFARRLAALRRMKAEELLSDEAEMLAAAAALAQRFHCGRAAAIDWLLGSYPMGALATLHPVVSAAVVPLVASAAERAVRYGVLTGTSLGLTVSTAAWSLGAAAAANPQVRRAYSW